MGGELSGGRAVLEWIWRWRRVLVGAGVLFCVLGLAQSLPTGGPQLVPVPVLQSDLPQGAALSEAQWDSVLVPSHVRDRWAAADPQLLRTDRTGVAAAPLPAGVPVPGFAVLDPGAQVAGSVQVAVTLADSSVQQLLSPGMQVDLVGFPDDGPARVIASRATVISAQVENGAGGMWDSGTGGPLLVAVSEAEALVLAEAVLRGPISLLIVG